MIESIPPGMLLVLGALAVPLLRGRLQQAYMLALPILGMLQVFLLPNGFDWSLEFFGYSLTLVRVDELSRVFAYVFHIAAFLAIIYALHVKDNLAVRNRP